MVMDLLDCGHTVEVLSDAKDAKELRLSWESGVSKQMFAGINFLHEVESEDYHLARFDRIIVGGKLDLLYADVQETSVVTRLLDTLHQRRHKFRDRVTVFWDDVPFERCLIKPEAAELCPKVPDFVEMITQLGHRFDVLSLEDKARMVHHMNKNNISKGDVHIDIWPLSIARMQAAIPNVRFLGASADRHLVTMMGNQHPVNKRMVSMLFEEGAVARICQEITERGNNVKLLFLGGLADVAKEMKRHSKEDCECVQVRPGFISDETLEHEIFPKTRAVLNPFFEDVNSGISVKNFESIMSGVPFLTSEYGMHGLSDEITACGSFPMPNPPNNVSVFADFFIKHILSDRGYFRFAKDFAENAPKCIAGQQERYPTDNIC